MKTGREGEDMNRTREAGNRDGVEGVVANTLNLLRNGASLLANLFGVGFIDWLGVLGGHWLAGKSIQDTRVGAER